MRHYLLLLASVVLIVVTSCAATFNTISTVSMTAPTDDNAELNCQNPAILWPVTPGVTPRTLHLKAIQGTFSWEDSSLTTAGTRVTFGLPYFPTAAQVKLIGWASDNGGAGCRDSIYKTPVSTTKPPAKVTF